MRPMARWIVTGPQAPSIAGGSRPAEGNPPAMPGAWGSAPALPLAAALLAVAVATVAMSPAAAPAADEPPATARVLIIGGLSAEPQGPYARNMRDWMARFAALMRKQGVAAGHITVLAETADANATSPVAQSTLANVKAAFETVGRDIRPQDQFVLFLVGQGTVTEPVGKLCLPGPDLNADELARLLDGLLTRNIAVINCASGGAEMLSKCARPGRVIVSASGVAGEGVQTYFAEFFLLGYETARADRDGDGKIDLLEAFNWSAAECVDWYHRQAGLKMPEGAKRTREQLLNVYGREACRLFRKFHEGTNLKLNAEGSRPDEPDAAPSELAGSMKGEPRETTELASLEDRGEPSAAAVHWVRNQHVFLTGQADQQGATAARTILGRPAKPPATPAAKK